VDFFSPLDFDELFFVGSFCDVGRLPPSVAFFGNNIYTKPLLQIDDFKEFYLPVEYWVIHHLGQ
jgi:hypothetical protein